MLESVQGTCKALVKGGAHEGITQTRMHTHTHRDSVLDGCTVQMAVYRWEESENGYTSPVGPAVTSAGGGEEG